MGVVLGERDIRREIMKHRGRSEKFLMKTCNSSCQVPISGGNVWRRSCQCTSDCGYFLPLLTSSCWKAHKWLLQNEGHNFSYFPFATAFLFWQEKCFTNNWFVIKVKSKQGSWFLFTRAKQKQHFDLMGTRPRCSTVIKEKLKKSFGGLAVWEEIRMKSWEPSLMIGCYIFSLSSFSD